MEQEMRVTVITPSKNQGKYIDHCLRSVHEQTHEDIEHIVLDAMSTDETAQVVRGYPCSFFQREDSGPAQAINQGLEMASGDIVCWLNADDAFFSRRVLERVIRAFVELPNVDVITGNGYFIDEEGKYLQPIVCRRPDRLCLRWIRKGDSILQPATFWRRSHFRLSEGLRYCFDWKLWIECFDAGLNILYLPEYFALYRRQPASLTQQDTALRKWEVYSMVREGQQNRVQARWCWIVWRVYKLSESLRMPVLKKLARVVNVMMAKLSGDRVVST
jgi:glycosyltransferase involved in cell wall biosynthesis